MNFFKLFFATILLHNHIYAYDVVDYLSRFFEKYDYSKIVYFIVECDSSSIENAVDVTRNLNFKWQGEKMNVISTAFSQYSGAKSTIFTNNLHQLEDALGKYSCNCTSTYNNEPSKPDNFLSVLSSIVDQLHYNETIFWFAITEHIGSWPDALQRKLEDKNVQINAIIPDSSRGVGTLENTIRIIGGKIFLYRIQMSKGLPPIHSNLEHPSYGYTYKINSIKKDNLMENSRTTFSLPEGTSSIILTIHGVGALQRVLLISPSGVTINLLPPLTQITPSEPESVISFKLPIFDSPADWTLSASGIKYNVTMTLMIKTRIDGINGATHRPMNFMNENSLLSYRTPIDSNKDLWKEKLRQNSASMQRFDNKGLLLPDNERSNQAWSTENMQQNAVPMKRYDIDGSSIYNIPRSNQAWSIGNEQQNADPMKRYDNDGSSIYNIQRSNQAWSTGSVQQNADPMKRYDNDGSSIYNIQSNSPNTAIKSSNALNDLSTSTIIDVDIISTFYVYPGEEARIVFNVRNNDEVPSKHLFHCHYMDHPCSVYPAFATLLPQEHVQVIVNVRASGSSGSTNIVGLISMSESTIDKKVYLSIGRPRSDRKRPDIDYEYNGNCDDASTGNTCLGKRWGADVIAQDRESGLLNFWSEPQGLIHTSEFIVGTREDVPARYTASCCNPKVDILASDLQGNTYRITLNVEHQFLSVIEIIVIILAGIILILLVSGIVFGFMKWRRRNRDTSFLKRSPTQRYNADQ